VDDDVTTANTAEKTNWACRPAWRATTTTRRRSTVLAILAVAAAVGLAACGGSSSPHVASLGTSDSNRGEGSATSQGRAAASSLTTPSSGNPTRLLDEWAACERSHGDPNQADPTIDAYGVIYVTIPRGGLPAGDPHDVTGLCSQYLAAAQTALRAANPVAPPPDQAQQVKYVNCMRANGVPNYPYPTGNTTTFRGTGVDPDSPMVQNANKLCGQRIGAPAWWINGTGPPGDVVVSNGVSPNNRPPACVFQKQGSCANGAGSNSGSGGGA
jgi:hypothetical protein